MDVDFGMIIKNYGIDKGEHHQERRYSAPEVTSMPKMVVAGYPNPDLISTSHTRATERHHAPTHAPLNSPDLCFQQKAGKLRGGCGSTLRVLQLRAHT